MDKPLIERLKCYYNDFRDADLNCLGDYYSEQVVFKDPVQELHGLLALQDYFNELSAHLQTCQFEYIDQLVTADTAYLKWNMHFRHRKLGSKRISVRGITQLQFNDVIYYHEDIYDMGSMIYEHVPGLGHMLRWIKSRLAK